MSMNHVTQMLRLITAALLLSACQGTTGSAPGTAPVASSDAAEPNLLRRDGPPHNHCRADAAASLVGQTYGSAALAQALQAADADVARKLHHDSIITKEFQQGRVNVVIDETKRIVRVYCG